jgi:pimeloyl-ACP methyl ester carboxylesterase
VQLCVELEEPLLQACSDPRYAGYEVVVTGHSLGGCTSEVVALKLREMGRQKGLEMLTKTRCLAFAGGPAATPDLQQSEESQELTICVVYGDDVVPRLGAATVCTLLDELSEHGVGGMALQKLGISTGESVRPTQLALGGRVIWIDPNFSRRAQCVNGADSSVVCPKPLL